MGYKNLKECLLDLEQHGHLVRIRREVDPYLEMASIHMRVYDAQGPALLFERVKGSPFPAVSNLFGTLERSRFMFRDTLDAVQKIVQLRNDPMKAIKRPLAHLSTGLDAWKALPKRVASRMGNWQTTHIQHLPQVVNWPKDGGPFITMPQVYTEAPGQGGIMQSNLGMYRIQLGGNQYQPGTEVGLHYQIHRGIGVHQALANERGEPLKVSIFVGGPPAHALSAVMPLPEGLPELTFAGVLGGRRFRYFYDDAGFCISADADFVITGTVYPGENKPEGPFGDHLGYYSLEHPFPVMKVHKVYHKKDAVWSFTVVGRPPQEDTSFGALIHEITGSAIPQEIAGLKAVHAVDAAGVHPLLFAIGSERYTPYLEQKRPQELLTIANQILGKNQLSLAKYLFIATEHQAGYPNLHQPDEFLTYILERIDLGRDLHFYTQTTIDTLDYSGNGLNSGSKLVLAAVGDKKRELARSIEETNFPALRGFDHFKLALPGVLIIQTPPFSDYPTETTHIEAYCAALQDYTLNGVMLLVLVDDAAFTSATLNNFLWVSFTKSNPSHDVYGVGASIQYKHWRCKGPLLIDARKKPHHAPELIKDPDVEKQVDALGAKGGPLAGII